MIQDTAKVSLFDGTHAPAMEIYPGRQVLSFSPTRQIKRVIVRDKVVSNHSDAICLLLSNGQSLTGSRDQKVAVFVKRNVMFRQMADIEIGDNLRGERSGLPVVVSVIGLAFDHRPVRLVGLDLRGKNFVAEGVLCK